MKLIKITTFESLQFEISNVPRQKVIFRGVKDSEKHTLITSIGRTFNSNQAGTGFPSFERRLFTRFKERAIPYLRSVPTTDLEWLALAQHHGLPTRLLDWSYNPLVALFFATQQCNEDPTDNSLDCAVYIYKTPNKTLNSSFTDDPFKVKNTSKYRPSHFTDRIVAQRSVFTLHHEPKISFEDNNRIIKLVIPGPQKPQFREKLRLFGVGPSTLFPGLDGLAEELSIYEKPFKSISEQV